MLISHWTKFEQFAEKYNQDEETWDNPGQTKVLQTESF